MIKKIIKLILVLFITVFILSLLGSNDDTSSLFNDNRVERPIDRPETTETPKSRGQRTLGLGINNGSIGFNTAFFVAQEVKTEVVEIPTFWDEIETAPGEFNGGWLPIADSFYPKTNTSLSISLNPIDSKNLRLPNDLKGRSFNDPELIKRYKDFVSYTATQVTNSEIFFISVGNEIDVYLGNSDEKWKEYTMFFESVVPHIRSTFPEAVVGSKIPFNTLINKYELVRPLMDASDVVLTNYYPFQENTYLMRDTATVYGDFKLITETYPDKQIYFAEIGYPSSEINDSSEAKQAAFITDTFIAWDIYADRIPFLNFIWLHDISDEELSGYQKYYGSKNKGFTSYLGTLGLRTHNGEDKPAYLELRKAVSERNW